MRTAFVVLLLVLPALAGCIASDDIAPAAVLPELPPPTRVHSLQIDMTRWSGEPSILAMKDGTLLITGAGGLTRYAEDPADAVGNAGQSYVWRSTDGGATWTFVDLGLPGPLATLLPYRNAIVGVEGDLAEDESGRAYFVDLAALVINGIASSTDSGKTWLSDQDPLVGLPGADRPWVAAWGDGEVYVKYLQTSTGHRVARSTNAGLTFLEDVALPSCGQGAIVADVASHEMVIPCVQGAELSILRTAAGDMKWESIPVLTADGPASNVFTSLAVAGPRQYIYAWSERVDDGARVRISTTDDGGATWSAPLTVSAPERTAVFPWVDANTDGAVGVVWYEADAWGEPATLDAAWFPRHAAFSWQAGGTLHAGAVTELSDEPVHQGAICTSGLGCVLDGRAKDRRLLDFFEVDVDASGTSHVTWTNTRTDVPSIWYGQVDVSPAGTTEG